ncbi:MAG: hypothetical protein ACLU9X_10350 [Alistipes shahii]
MQIISFLPVESGVSYRQVEARLAAGAYWRLKISSGLRMQADCVSLSSFIYPMKKMADDYLGRKMEEYLARSAARPVAGRWQH